MATKAKPSMSDKLNKLQQKLSNTNMGGGGNTGFWSPVQGMNMIRILPEVGEMPYFFQEVGQHRLNDGSYVNCPSFTSEGEHDCPICQLVAELYRGSEADKKLAGVIKVGRKYWMNIVVRNKADDTGGNTHEGPFIYTPGVIIMKEISAIINMPDYGDITDEEEGTDLIIQREGERLDTTYSVQARRHSCPISTDEAAMDEIMDKAVDLSWVMLSDDPEEDSDIGEGFYIKILPYDRMVSEYGLAPGMSSREVTALLDASTNSNASATNMRDTIDRRKAGGKPQVAKPGKATKSEDGYEEVEEAFATAATERRKRRRS